jgi:DNA-binding response OmpR family regulator
MPKKILVIDDEKSILQSLAGILSDEGFIPVWVSCRMKDLSLSVLIPQKKA